MASIAEPGRTRIDAPGATVTDTSFPGNIVSGVCMIVAPTLLIAGSLLLIGIYNARGVNYVHGMATHHARAAVSFNLAVAGTVLLIIGLIRVAREVAVARPWLGRAGGLLAIVGLFGPLFFNGVYFGGFQVTDPGLQAAAGKMIDQAQIIPSNVINLSGPALVIGFILLAIGTAKTGVLSRPRAIALGATCLIPVGFISGVIAIAALGFLGTAIALVPLGVQTLRDHAQTMARA